MTLELPRLTALRDVADAKHAAIQAAFQSIVQEENRLRGLLSDLDRQEVECRRSLSRDPTLRMLGGDVAWHAWLGQNREILNVSLANTLARKEATKTEFQKASGKNRVIDELCSDLTRKRRKERDKRLQLDLEAIALGTIRRR